MAETATSTVRKRPEFRNINALSDLPSYRLPAAGWVSILHRVSGVLMFILMPFIIWMFDTSISSEISYARFTGAFSAGMLGLPGFVWKLVALALIWAYLHHFCAGIRHLFWDAGYGFELPTVHLTGKLVLAATAVLSVLTWIVIFAVR